MPIASVQCAAFAWWTRSPEAVGGSGSSEAGMREGKTARMKGRPRSPGSDPSCVNQGPCAACVLFSIFESFGLRLDRIDDDGCRFVVASRGWH
eukprot:1948098-Pleurochrysis_carterae.AAC.1